VEMKIKVNKPILLVAGILLMLSPALYWLYDTIFNYAEKTGMVVGWNHQPAFGYNIFFADDSALFLHGDSPELTDFLNNLTLNRTYTFRYHIQRITYYNSDITGETWYHVTEIRDEDGKVIFRDDLWQEWGEEKFPPWMQILCVTLGIVLVFSSVEVVEVKK